MAVLQKKLIGGAASEIVKDTFGLSLARRKDGKLQENLLARSTQLLKKLNGDIRRTWYSEDRTPRFIAESMLAEAGELLGEFTKEQRKAGEDRTRQLSSELVDMLYFAVRYIDVKKFDLREGWLKAVHKLRENYHGMVIAHIPPKALAHYVLKLSYDLSYSENMAKRNIITGKPRNNTIDEEANINLILVSLFQIAKKREIDIERAWEKKIVRHNKVA